MPLASSFLAGSILTLVMPVAMFIALAIWYVKFVRNVPDTTDGSAAQDGGGAQADAAAPQSEP